MKNLLIIFLIAFFLFPCFGDEIKPNPLALEQIDKQLEENNIEQNNNENIENGNKEQNLEDMLFEPTYNGEKNKKNDKIGSSKVKNKLQNGLSTLSEKITFKKKKQSEELDEKSGYYGTLPDINKAFQYKNQSSKSTKYNNSKNFDEDDIDDFQQAPYDDPLFIDKVLKKEKSSDYIKDVQKLKFSINALKQCIENEGDIQRFNGCVNVLDLYTNQMTSKYNNTSDSMKESYRNIINLNYKAKLLGNLIYESNYYSQFSPVNMGKYSKDNIYREKQNLLVNINRTLFSIIKEE